jgi:predicted metal-binding protein
MEEMIILTKTPSAEIFINTKFLITESFNLLQYENKITFENLCKEGCPNYDNKWACPPYSPAYSSYSKGYSKIFLMLFFCTLNQFSYINSDFLKVKASNSILKAKIEKYLRKLEIIYHGKMISNGSCRLCKPCNIKKFKSECKRPSEMRFSMESLGVNVEKISKDLFDHELLWYRNKKIPLYTSVVSGILTNEQIDQRILREQNLLNNNA